MGAELCRSSSAATDIDFSSTPTKVHPANLYMFMFAAAAMSPRFGWSRKLPLPRAMGSRVGNSLISSPWCGSIAPKSKGHGMSISATEVRFDDATMWVSLTDGRILGVPLAWFPRLLAAAPVDLQRYELSPTGIHWDGLDEDISIAGLLAGRGDQTRPVSMAAE